MAIVLVAFGAALVIAQRRRVEMRQDYAHRILRAHEAERAWIAGELHDDALQRVALIRRELDGLWSAVARVASPDEQHHLKALSAELLDLGVTLRNLAQRLHPAVVDQLGLVRALAALTEEMGRTHGLAVTLAAPENGAPVHGPVAHAAYRIVQEALRNVARHAGVLAADVSLYLGRDSLILRVRDSGHGFPADSPSTRTGLGIVAMRERAAYVGGRLELHATPAGTTVEAQLPLAQDG